MSYKVIKDKDGKLLATGWTIHPYINNDRKIGASTCVFGAIGILAGLQFFDKIKRKSLRSWAPLAGAFAFLTLFGQGEKIDFGAHLFGFFSGLIFSIPMFLIITKKIISLMIIQRLLSGLSLLFIIFCWCKAFKI